MKLSWSQSCIGLVGIIVFLVVLAAGWPYFPVRSAKHNNCISNLKQLSLGLLVYAADSDDKLPPSYSWYDSALSRGRGLKLTCSNAQHQNPSAIGYAFDSRLESACVNTTTNPSGRVMIYDSTSIARNPADAFTSLPNPARHASGNAIGHMDGHVKWVR